MLRTTLSLALLLAGSAFSALASPIYYLSTDITGAQTQIDINHTSTWLLTPNTPFDLAGGLFEMKDGPSTTDTVVLSLYQGLSALGTLLAQVTLTNASFCAQVANCQSFGTHSFLFGAPVALSTGVTYFAALTSIAPDTQSTAYFIKNDRSYISDADGNPITPDPIGTTGTTTGGTTGGGGEVPEPGSFALVGLGLAAFGLQRYSRRS